MSDENTQEVANEANANIDTEKLLAEIEQLRSTKERLLAESNKYKTRKSEVEELREKLNSYEKRELEKKGDWEKRLQMEREERQKLEGMLETQKNKILKSNVFNAVANMAKDAHDVNDLLAQREFANMIEVDEETLEPVKESVQSFVNALKENKKYLFKGHKIATMADTKPSIEKPQERSVKNMNMDERKTLLKNALASLSHNV